MKKLILAITLVSASFAVNASNRPIDGNRSHIDSVKGANAFADYVVATGYRCDSITSFMGSAWNSKKFTLKCNSYRYVYTIEDKGGRWVVSVD